MSNFDDNVTKYAQGRGAQYMPLYQQAATKYGIPVDILVKQGAQESGFWDADVISGRKASSAGALGVAQFMPATAQAFGINPRDAAQSIDAQAKYMAKNLKMFDGDMAKALAGYNWGEGNVQKKGMGRLPAETREYIKRILGGAKLGELNTNGDTDAAFATQSQLKALDDPLYAQTMANSEALESANAESSWFSEYWHMGVIIVASIALIMAGGFLRNKALPK